MTSIAAVCQVVIALGVVNVWLVRQRRPTPWRPEGAANLAEELRRYGLPGWTRPVVGAAKLALAALLVVGIWFPALAFYAAIGMALLMAGAVAAHLRIHDPLSKSLPAFSLLLLSLLVAFANAP